MHVLPYYLLFNCVASVLVINKMATQSPFYLRALFGRSSLRRRGGSEDAEVLSVWRYCKHCVTDGIQWRTYVQYKRRYCCFLLIGAIFRIWNWGKGTSNSNSRRLQVRGTQFFVFSYISHIYTYIRKCEFFTPTINSRGTLILR